MIFLGEHFEPLKVGNERELMDELSSDNIFEQVVDNNDIIPECNVDYVTMDVGTLKIGTNSGINKHKTHARKSLNFKDPPRNVNVSQTLPPETHQSLSKITDTSFLGHFRSSDDDNDLNDFENPEGFSSRRDSNASSKIALNSFECSSCPNTYPSRHLLSSHMVKCKRNLCDKDHEHNHQIMSFEKMAVGIDYVKSGFDKKMKLKLNRGHVAYFICKKREKTKCPAHLTLSTQGSRIILKGCSKHEFCENQMNPTPKTQSYICDGCGNKFACKRNQQQHIQLNRCKHNLLCQENHQHKVLDRTFPTLQDANNFIELEELDKNFIINSTLPNHVHEKKIYICINRQNRQKDYSPRSKKTSKTCPAKFSLEKNLDNTYSIKGTICHDHEIVLGNLRLSKAQKSEYVDRISKGVPSKRIFSDYDIGMF